MLQPRKHGKWLAAILLLAAVLRLIRLGTFPYWQDEVHNLIKAEHIGAVVTKGELVSNHPPLFAILVTFWRTVGLDASEWTMRSLPALLGVLTVAATYWVGSRLINVRTGLISAFLVAISPFFIVHSQDLKIYILLPLTGTILAWVLYEAANRNTAIWWIAYAICAGVACYSDVYAGPLLVGLNVWFLLQLRGRVNRLPGWIAANVAGAAAFAPYLGILLRRADLMLVRPEIWWLQKPTPIHVAIFLKTVAFGYSDTDPLFEVALALFCCAAAAGVFVAFGKGWRPGTLLLCWLVLPVAAMYVGSQFVNSFFLIRALLPFAIPFYILTGALLGRIENRYVRGVSVVLFAAMAALPIWQHYTRQLPVRELPHRPGIHFPFGSDEAAQFIAANFKDGDVVVHTSAPTWFPFYWYGLRDRPQVQAAVGDDHISLVDAMGPATTAQAEYAGYFPRDVRAATANAQRVWLIFADWEREYLTGNPMQVWRWVNANFAEREAIAFSGLDVRLYESLDATGPAVYRDHDDGVSAAVRWRADSRARNVVVPDTELVPQPSDTRTGALRLSFSPERSEAARSVASTSNRRTVNFTLMNTSQNDRRVTINALASDAMLSAVTFTRGDDSDIGWQTAAQHNPDGSPPHYELATSVAHFSEAGTAIQSTSLSLPQGHYDSSVYAIATPEDTAHARASLSVFVEDRDILARAPRNRTDLFGWRWIRGEPVYSTGEVMAVRMVASHLLGLPNSYADVIYVALTQRRGTPRAQSPDPFLQPWPGELTIGAAERLTWSLEVDAEVARVDVWAHEEEPNGRVYHIFDVRETAN